VLELLPDGSYRSVLVSALAENLIPCTSGGVCVFVEDAAEAIESSYAEAGNLLRIGDRRGQGVQRAGAGDALVRAVPVAELPGLAQDVAQVPVVPDQGAVQ
jgi:hypothetical protein